jgi:hypothetical protein
LKLPGRRGTSAAYSIAHAQPAIYQKRIEILADVSGQELIRMLNWLLQIFCVAHDAVEVASELDARTEDSLMNRET